eukprot:gene5431-10893_t
MFSTMCNYTQLLFLFICIAAVTSLPAKVGIKLGLRIPLGLSATQIETLQTPISDADLVNALLKSSLASEKLKFHEVFRCLAQHPTFVNKYWQKAPFLCQTSLPNVAGAFTMEDVKNNVDKDFLEAGRGTFSEGKGGWNMAAVSQPRGNTFQDAKLRFEDIQMAMKAKSGTVVFNSAGGFIPPLADVCLQCIQAFDIPTALNMYLTAAGQETSAPPHTDKQDVIVMQTQGQKRWRVFTPPPPKRMPRADPFARGKASDEFDLRELDAPLIDTVLSPGQILYVPGGFPHTTDTLNGVSSTEPSVHLTVGLDTHIWGITYTYLRNALLARNSLPDKVQTAKLDPDVYWSLQDCLPLGFLQASTSTDTMSIEIGKRLRAAEPGRWPLPSPPGAAGSETEEASAAAAALALSLGITEEEIKFRQHHRIVTDIFRKMYADVAFKMTPVQMDLSFFRSKPYFTQLENTMETFVTSI